MKEMCVAEDVLLTSEKLSHNDKSLTLKDNVVINPCFHYMIISIHLFHFFETFVGKSLESVLESKM